MGSNTWLCLPGVVAMISMTSVQMYWPFTRCLKRRDSQGSLSEAAKRKGGNGPTTHDGAQMPFGGMKESGIGRFGGADGIHELTI